MLLYLVAYIVSTFKNELGKFIIYRTRCSLCSYSRQESVVPFNIIRTFWDLGHGSIVLNLESDLDAVGSRAHTLYELVVANMENESEQCFKKESSYVVKLCHLTWSLFLSCSDRDSQKSSCFFKDKSVPCLKCIKPHMP